MMSNLTTTIQIDDRMLDQLKLTKELTAAGIWNEITYYPHDGIFHITVKPKDYERALQIINQHDPTPEPTQEDVLMDIQAAIAFLLGGGQQ